MAPAGLSPRQTSIALGAWARLVRPFFGRICTEFPLPSAGNPLQDYLILQKRNPSKLVHGDSIGHAGSSDLFEYRF
jgi:hypothetical protein